jgi:hypothetical protein
MNYVDEFLENLKDCQFGIDVYEMAAACDVLITEPCDTGGDAFGVGFRRDRRVERGGNVVTTDACTFRVLLRSDVVDQLRPLFGDGRTTAAIAYVRILARHDAAIRNDLVEGDNSLHGGNGDTDTLGMTELLILLDERGYHLLNDVAPSATQRSDDDVVDPTPIDDAPSREKRRRDFETLHALLETYCDAYRQSWSTALFMKLSAVSETRNVDGERALENTRRRTSYDDDT